MTFGFGGYGKVWENVAGGGARLPSDGSPSLILDFVAAADPVYGDTLTLDFVNGIYRSYATDPSATDALINIQVWN